MKLTKCTATRQRRLVEALRKGRVLGGILAGLAAFAPVAGCKDRVSEEMTGANKADTKPKACAPKLATTNAASEAKSSDSPPLVGKIAPPTNRVREVTESPVRVMGLKAASTNRVREVKSPNRRPLMGKIAAPPKSSSENAGKQ